MNAGLEMRDPEFRAWAGVIGEGGGRRGRVFTLIPACLLHLFWKSGGFGISGTRDNLVGFVIFALGDSGWDWMLDFLEHDAFAFLQAFRKWRIGLGLAQTCGDHTNWQLLVDARSHIDEKCARICISQPSSHPRF